MVAPPRRKPEPRYKPGPFNYGIILSKKSPFNSPDVNYIGGLPIGHGIPLPWAGIFVILDSKNYHQMIAGRG
jgi:hypothetical protein